MEEKGKDYEERRGRGRGRGRGRPRGRAKAPPRGLRVKKRNMIESEEEEEEPTADENEPPKAKQYDQDCDISSLEAPTFTTLDRGPPAPMLRLSWDHPVNLIGEKVLSPRIHICDACNKPILIYGRMIPCKHVFCLWCARSEDRVCARCGERVARVEQTGLGTVFMCNYTINKAVCKRTYLSQRDLQAHIDHRHMKMSGAGGVPKEDIKEERLSHRDPRGEGRDARGDPRGDMRQDPRSMTDPRIGKEGYEHRDSYTAASQFSRQGSGQFGSSNNHQQPHQSPSNHQGSSHISLIPVMTSSRTNLITVPLQDPPEHTSSHSPFPHPSPTHPPPPHIPPTHPPPSHSFTSPPPAHSQTQPYNSTFTTPYNTHNTLSTHNTHNTHNTHSTHNAHNTHNTHNSHSTQSAQYTYPPNPATVPQQSHTVPPPLYSSVAPTVPPPTTYGNRPQYEGQYGTTQWSTPPPQAAPSHQSAPSLHHSSLSSVQSSQYYRKNF